MSANLIHYPPNPAYGTGVYRRRITFTRRADGIDVALLDDYHDMVVSLTVDGHAITNAAARMDRFPKTSCPGAVAALRALIGRPLATLALSAEERGGQCTHLVELARLGLNWLAQHEHSGIVEIALTDRDASGEQRLVLHVHGKPVLAWVLRDEIIVEPADHRGQVLFGGFIRWVQAAIPPDEADLWRMAQMAVFVARGRAYLVDSQSPRRVAEEPSRFGACFSYSGAAFETAHDNTGYVRDFSGGLPPMRYAAPELANQGA
ncbi:MAG: DUF2889 domain-containing protein [Novosphingobium sp.]|uniref:DUF2889 domain-containing protein n=1 Tax=Novosphingobium sp. TaxID=1874826 RepID=UPI003017CB1F